MRKSILAVLFSLTVCISTWGQKITEDNFQQMRVTISVPQMKQEKAVVDGRQFTQLSVMGMQSSAQVGAPNLPTWSAIIEVPVCRDYAVEVSGTVYDTIKWSEAEAQWPVIPVQPSRRKSDSEQHPLVMDKNIYTTDAYFAAAPLAMVEPVGVARDRQLARLQFSPVSYNPVRGELVVCREATVTVQYVGADEKASKDLFNRYCSPMFGAGTGVFNNLYPKAVRTSAPVRYLIVAHSMFRGYLDEFVNWKRRKGFITDVVYTDDPSVGTTSTSIAAYVKSQYDNATATNPAPTYLVLVGDHEQIPAFSAQVTSPSSDHITDLYYATWTTGDHIPDCYYGRFSAQTVAQLTPQIEKTLMYEQYTFSDPSFLDRAVMVAGVDGGTSGDNGYRYGDPAMDYAVTNYVNGAHGFSQVKYFKNDVSIVPSATNVTVASSSSSNAATVRSYYNQGAGWINYTAHGSATSWGTPSFTTTDAAAMTNSQKFGIMIGNCCLTNRFQVATCLGESLLRKGEYCGAVGYIGGSNSTYWGEDFYWAVGVRSNIGPTMSMAYNGSNLGNYDRAFHTHNEAYADWATTQGSLVMFGNMAVESSTSSSNYKHYYWEIYHLMGDPSLMPYLTQAQEMTLTASSVLMAGASSLSVTAAPYAYVSLTDTLTHTLWASGYADATGNVTLSIPAGIAVGGYELVASAQQYRTAFRPLSVLPPSGPYPVVVSVTPSAPVVAGTTVTLTIKVANLGNSNATGVNVTLASDSPYITLSSSTINVGGVTAGDTVVRTVSATVSSQAPDATQIPLATTTQWSGCTAPSAYGTSLSVTAPKIVMSVTPSATHMLPNGDITITVGLTNNGHAPLGASQFTLTTGNSLMTVSGGQWSVAGLAVGASVSHQFQMHAAATMDSDIFVPVYLSLLTGQQAVVRDTLQIYIGANSTETFEGGQLQWDWTQGTAPWVCTSNTSFEGMWSARSAANLGNNSNSDMSISLTVTRADSIRFYYKVSSETNYDKFHCYLDGTEMVEASGEIGWTRAAFPVSVGSHQLLFSYTKDVSQSNGSDCAWIDNVQLPYGTQVASTGNGGDPVEETFENLIANFESAADDSRWTLVNGSLTNVWVIGTAASNGNGRGLYISCDEGQTNTYNTDARDSSVFAYTTLWIDADLYDASFDWRCNGESTYDYLRAALVPATVSLAASSSLPSGWSTSALPTGAIALDGGQKLNLSSSWSTKQTQVQIAQSGWYRLVFFWRNDNSQGSMPPAAIDNVSFVRHVVTHTVTVNAVHGVATGSGTYPAGDTAIVGVYPEAGYTFTGWNDGNLDNPRQLVVLSNRTLTANLSQGGTVVQHDTTYIDVVVHDTIEITQVVTQHDTVTEYLQVHDTTYVEVGDTITLTDTVTVTEYVPVYDTVNVPVHDTSYVILTDTVTLTEYVAVHDTSYITLTDTVTLTEYVAVHDTSYVTLTDTVTLTEYVAVHDTSYVTLTDTVTLTEYVPVYDTMYITLTDTVVNTVFDTVTNTIIDTVNNFFYDTVTVTDTMWWTTTDTIWLHDTVFIFDTVVTHDTIYITEQGIDGGAELNLKVYPDAGQVVVEGAGDNRVMLYDVTGRILATKRDEYMPLRFDVPASGTYMIKVGGYPARKIVMIR